MLSHSPVPGVSGTPIEDALCESLHRLAIAFAGKPHLLPNRGQKPTANYQDKCFRGERAVSLALFLADLMAAGRAMGGSSFVAYVINPLLALFDLEATPRGEQTADLKRPAEESFDAHRATASAVVAFDEAAADGEFTEAERREVTHRVTTAQEELADLADVAGVER